MHQRRRDAFLDIAKREPDRCKVIDAAGDAETIAAQILRHVGLLIKSRKAGS